MYKEENNLSAATVLLRFENARLRAFGTDVLDHVNIEIRKGQHYAIIGESGSGKTSLLKALSGEMPVINGKRSFPVLEDMIRNGTVPVNRSDWHHYTAFVDVRHHFTDTRGSSDFYYQQRFNAGDSEHITTVANYLEVFADHKTQSNWFRKVITMMNLEGLKEKVLIQLSSGETRRLLIGAALLEKPMLLLLDMPLTGMDKLSRETFNILLGGLGNEGVTVVMTTSADQVPENISEIIVLENKSIKLRVKRKDFRSDSYLKNHEIPLDTGAIEKQLAGIRFPIYRQLVLMQQINIRYGDTVVINQLDWEIKQGEKWAVVGANGAGKSTLLSLITADHPQGYANHFVLFDRKRGSGESIWDIKKNIGFVSYELFQYFPGDQNCLQVMESGFYDTIGLFRLSSSEKVESCRGWMKIFNISEYGNRLFRQVPTSVQRLCLLVRALVKNPVLLILDEPCQGLDDIQQLHFKKIVTAIAAHPEISMIYVTHHLKELPESFNKVLELTRGKPARVLNTKMLA